VFFKVATLTVGDSDLTKQQAPASRSMKTRIESKPDHRPGFVGGWEAAECLQFTSWTALAEKRSLRTPHWSYFGRVDKFMRFKVVAIHLAAPPIACSR